VSGPRRYRSLKYATSTEIVLVGCFFIAAYLVVLVLIAWLA